MMSNSVRFLVSKTDNNPDNQAQNTTNVNDDDPRKGLDTSVANYGSVPFAARHEGIELLVSNNSTGGN